MSSRPRPRRSQSSRAAFDAVEPRILFSADGFGGIEIASDHEEEQALVAPLELQDPSTSANETGTESTESPRYELIVVDERMLDPGFSSIEGDLYERDGILTEVVTLAADEDGIGRVTELLATREGIDTVHLVVAKDETTSQLGRVNLDQTTLTARAGDISTWSDAIGADGDVLLYGFAGAADAQGAAFASKLSLMSGRDVAATDDPAGLGGNQHLWDVEYRDGVLERAVVHTEVSPDTWSAVLGAARSIQDGAEADDGRLELVFVDSEIEGYQALVDDIESRGEAGRIIDVIVINSSEDGIDVVSESLAAYQGVDSIHIISHGDGDSIHLGSALLDSETLKERRDEIAAWGTSLDDSGDILVYGCNLAATENGRELVEQLAGITAADIAASDDLTGALDLGGDWDLEYRHGLVETSVVISLEQQATFSTTLFLDETNNAPSFSIDGGVTNTPVGDGDAHGSAIAIQSDGKVLTTVQNEVGGVTQFTIVRHNVDGALDTGFGSNGEVSIEIGSSSNRALDIEIQSDGKIVAVGGASDGVNEDVVVVRYLSNGTLDTAFGNNGIVRSPYTAVEDVGRSVAIHADGSIVVGASTNSTGTDTFFVLQYNPDGSPDNGYGGSGYTLTTFGGSGQLLHDVAIQDNGKIVAVGEGVENTGTVDFLLARYNEDGTLDTSFGGDGKVSTELHGGIDVAREVVIQADGKIVVVGSTNVASIDEVALVRYNVDGSLDSTFGVGGKVKTSIGTGDTRGYSVALDDAGRFLVAGTNDNGTDVEAVVLRYLSDGTIDTSFGASGGLALAATDASHQPTSLVVRDDNSVVVSGTNTVASQSTLATAHVTTEGTLDLAYGAQSSVGGTVAYVEQNAPVVLDSDAGVFDAELSSGNNFDGATLTLSRLGGAQSEDAFGFGGHFTFSGEGQDLLRSGVVVGTVDQASAGELRVTFNSNATNTRVNEAMRSITYENTSDAPPTSVTIQWTFSDENVTAQGSGGALSVSGDSAVSITAAPDAPVLTGDNDITGEEGKSYSLFPTGTVVDGDTDSFDGAVLSSYVSFGALSGDTLILDEVGGVTLSGGDVSVLGINVGVVAGGTSSSPLDVTFNANATTSDVQAVLRAVSYINYDDDPVEGTLTVTSRLTDGDGLSDTVESDFTLVAVNDAPVNTVPGEQSTPVDTSLAFSSAAGNDISVSDVEAGSSTIEVSLSVDNGTLSLDTLIPVTGEVSVNEVTAGTQGHVEISMESSGWYVAVWTSWDQDGDGAGVYAQIYQPDGTPFLDNFRVNTTTVGSQLDASVASDQDGNFVVVWDSVGQDGDGAGVYGQRFDASGNMIGSEFRVNTETMSDQKDSEIAMAPTGEFVVVWKSLDQDGDNYGIYGQRYDASGVAQGGEFQVNSTTAAAQDSPGVGMDANGNFTIVWSSDVQDGSDDGVYMRRYDAAGNVLTGEVQVNTETTNDQHDPVMAMNSAGDYVIVWRSELQDGSGSGVYAQLFDSTGAAVGSEFRANTETAMDQRQPSVSMADSGEFVIAWNSADQDLSGRGVYLQRYDSEGNPIGEEEQVHITTAGDQKAIEVGLSDEGTLAAVWHGEVPGDATGVVTRVFDAPPISFVVGDGADDETITIRGSVSEINAAIEGLRYTPDAGFVGIDTLTITTDDLGNYGLLGAQQDTDEVLIVVYGPAPIVDLDADNSVSSGVDFATTWTEGSGGVRVADVDARVLDYSSTHLTGLTVTIDNLQDGAAESLSVDTSGTGITATYDAGLGVLSLSGTDLVENYQTVLRRIEYDNSSQDPSAVTRRLTFTADDGVHQGSATTTLTMVPVNNAPIGGSDSSTVAEGGVVNVDVAANDTDPDSALDLTSIEVVGAPANGSVVVKVDGTIDYIHDGSETTTDSFTYTIKDASGAVSSATTVNLTITPVNDAPTAVVDGGTVNEGATVQIDLAANDTDPDNALDLTTIQIVGAPSNGSIVVNADGTVDYTHDGSETTTDSFTYTIKDASGAVSNTATVSLTVTPVNDAPTASNSTATLDEGATSSIDLAANVTDPDSTLDLTSIQIVGTPSNGSIVVNADGTIDYTHDGSETTSDNFTYTIKDASGAVSNTATVNLTITPVNDAPTAVVDGGTVNEGATVQIDLAANDTDPDNALDLTSIQIVGAPNNGSVMVNADGTIDYTHDGSETTTDSFTYTIKDAAGAVSNTATVSLTVTPVNDAPTATNSTATVNEGTTSTIDLAANVTDPDSPLDLTSIQIVGAPNNGSVVVNADGTVEYTHDGSETTTDSFTYTIKDASGVVSNTATLNLTITPVNDAPTAVVDGGTVDEGATVQIDLAANDTDPDNTLDLTSIQIAGAPSNGSVAVNADGTIDYTHDGSETISDSFTYTIKDASGAVSNIATVNLTITPVNDAPTASDSTSTVSEGAISTIDLAANVTDPDSTLDLTSIQIVGAPSNGTIVVNDDGSIDYVHDGSETTTDSFTYTIKDASGSASNSATVNLTITPVNDAPTPIADSATVNEGATVRIDLAGNDTDSDNALDLTSIQVVDAPSNGTVVVNTDGTVDYTHDGSETTADSFTYTIKDAAGATSNPTTVNLNVIAVNDAPTAVNGSGTVNEGATTTINLAANVIDPDSTLDLTSIQIVGAPSNGTIVVNIDGTIDYTHDGSETSTDSFTYTIKDESGAVSNVATTSITVTPVNDAPSANVDGGTVNEGATIRIDLAANDTDPDNALDANSIQVVGEPAHGTVTVNGDGTVNYAHDGSETTTDSFTYTIKDAAGATSNTSTVSLTITPVNDAPKTVVDAGLVDEGATVRIDVAANDTDPDDALDLASIQLVDAPSHGTVLVNADGTIDYTHDGSETLADSFTYTIRDATGAVSNTATVSLTVNALNDGPTATNGSGTVSEGSSLSVDLAALATDPDSTLDLTSIQIMSAPTNGTITVNADGTVDYVHDGSETASDSFTYTIKDNAGAVSNVATFALTVTPVNDSPIAGADAGTVNEGEAVVLNLVANDIDAEHGIDPSSVQVVSGPSNGTVSVSPAGMALYTHDGTETASDRFTYSIRDTDGAISNVVTVDLTVTPVNDTPVANNDSATTNEGATVRIDLSNNDTDADNLVDNASIQIVTSPSSGTVSVNLDGSVEYSHDGSETTSDSFVYTIRDAAGMVSNTASVNVTIVPINDAPIVGDDTAVLDEGASVRVDVSANDSDPDNAIDLSSIQVSSAPAHGSVVVNVDGTVDYTHDGSETTADSFTYTIRDASGAVSGSATVTLAVTPVNDAPTVLPDSGTVTEGGTVRIDMAANDIDPDGALDLGSIQIVAAPIHGSLTVNADGSVDYAHDGSETVTDAFSYTIKDASGMVSNTASVTVSVTPVNDAPVAVVDVGSVVEGTSARIDVLANDTDPDNALDPASVQIVSAPAFGTVVVNGDGTIDYTHDGSETTTDGFTYTVRDAAGAVSDVAVVNIGVIPANDAPTALSDSASLLEGGTVRIGVTSNDMDPDNALDLGSVQIVGTPGHGSVVVNADGTVDYTHDGSESVADSFTYAVKDASGALSNTATVNLTISAVNDAPSALADVAAVNEGEAVRIYLSANDADPDNALDLASIQVVSAPLHGNVVVNLDGTVDYTHDGSDTVADSFTYTIKDVSGAVSNVETVSISVTSGNDAPTAVFDVGTVVEGESLTVDLAGNDTDSDSAIDLSSIQIVGSPAHGVVSVNANGTIDYVHDGSESTADSFVYTIRDVQGAVSNPATAVITITPKNDAPIASGDAATVNEGATIRMDLAANDTDVDDALDLASIQVVGAPMHGSVVVNADGTIDYTHDGSETTNDTFTYTIRDATGAVSNLETVALTISPVNDAPTGLNSTATVSEGATSAITLTANVTDPDSPLDPASIQIVGAPTNGVIVVNGDGTVDYTHDGSETATDSFAYTIKDTSGAVSNPITITLTVTPVNDAPIASIDAGTVGEGATVRLDLSANDTDAENALDLTSIEIVGTPSYGSITVNGDGTVDYTHDGSESTSDGFTYTIKDTSGTISNSAAVILTVTPVNDAPIALSSTAIVEEGATSIIDLAAHASDPDNALDLASLQIISSPSNGSVVVNPDGTVTYTHDGSETSADSFVYTIKDVTGAVSNLASVDLVITPVNDAPTAVIDGGTVNEGTTIKVAVASNDTDPDDTLDLTSVRIVSGPSHGTVAVNADGTIDYTHDGSETVADSFSYTIADMAGAVSAPASVSLAVTPVNDSPIGADDGVTVAEGGSVLVDLADNDADPEGALDLSSIRVVGAPSHGSVLVNTDGTIVYTHDGSETTTDSFTYTIRDGLGTSSNPTTVTVSVTPLNDAPIGLDGVGSLIEGGTVGLNLVSGVTDADSALDLASIQIVSSPMHGTVVVNGDGTADYTHDGSETLVDRFTYRLRDASGALSNVIAFDLMVTPINDAPRGTADTGVVNEGGSVRVDLGINDIDPESALDLASIRIVSAPAHGTVIVHNDGTVDYVHDGSETSSDSFNYTIDDVSGAVSNVTSVSLTVTAVNDAPLALPDVQTALEGSTTRLNLAENDTDPEGMLDRASIQIIGGPLHGTVSVNADGTVDYGHDGSETTSDSFTYTIRDSAGAVSSVAAVNLTVAPVNDAPSASTDFGAVREGATVRLNLAANDSDPDSALDVGSIRVMGAPSHGKVTVNADGTVDYTHDGSETTADAFSYAIRDAFGATSNVAVVSINVTPEDDTPVFVSNKLEVERGGQTTLTPEMLLVMDPDNPDSAIEYSIVNLREGHFELTTAPGVPVTTFTQAQIISGEVEFIHSGSHNPPDYSVIVTDHNTSVGPLRVDFVHWPTGKPLPDEVDQAVTQPESGVTPGGNVGLPTMGGQGPILDGSPTAPQGQTLEVTVRPAGGADSSATAIFESQVVLELERVALAEPYRLLSPQGSSIERMPFDDERLRGIFNRLGEITRDELAAIEIETPGLEFDHTSIAPVVSGALESALREMGEQMQHSSDDEELMFTLSAAFAKTIGVALSVGSVSWLLRLEALFAAMLVSLPAWRGLDPLAVVKRTDEEEDRWAERSYEDRVHENTMESGAGRILDAAEDQGVRDVARKHSEDRNR